MATEEIEAKRQKIQVVLESQNFETSEAFFRLLVRTPAEDFAIEGDPSNAPIFMCHRSDMISEVWKGLVRHNFLSVPVVLKENQDFKYFGFVDMVDIARYIVEHFGPKVKEQADVEARAEAEKGSDETRSQRSFWDLISEMEDFNAKTVNDIMTWPLSRKNPFHPIKKDYSAFAVVEALAREDHLHRVPIIDRDSRMVNLVTQSQVVSFIHKHIALLGDKRSKPLKACPSLFKAVISVLNTDSALDAFSKMIQEGVTGVAVVDEGGRVVETLSIRDMKLLGHDAHLFFRLTQTVEIFTKKLKQQAEDLNRRPRSVVVAVENDTIEDVISKLTTNSLHRLFIVEPDTYRPIGVVSLKDLLLEIIS